MNWKQKYRDRKRPMRLKLTMAVLAENLYKSLSDKLVDSEQAAYEKIIEIETTEEQKSLF